MIFSVMEKYGIPSVEQLKRTWNRGQLYLAMDANFWNSYKLKKDYKAFTRSKGLKGVRASEVLEVIGLGGLVR